MRLYFNENCLLNCSGIGAHLKPDEHGVESVPTFNLMNLEWNWCPPLADEPSGIGAHLQPYEPGVELVPTFS
jgi:hypothetical protein